MSLIGDEKEYIFPDPAGKNATTENALSHHVRKDIPDTVKRPYGLPRWTPHDLRRTAATRILSKAVKLSMAAIYVDSVFMVAEFADISKYRSYIY